MNCFIFAVVVVIIVVPFHYHSLQLILMITFCLVVKQNECKWTQRHMYNTERECGVCGMNCVRLVEKSIMHLMDIHICEQQQQQ